MSHHCSTSLVRCIDFRLNKAVHDYLVKQGLFEDHDPISVAGGVKDKDYVIGQVALSKSLHETNQVVLINHTDCGAYGGRKAFSSAEEERARHTSDLHSARMKLESMFPGLRVRTAIADIRPEGIHIEEV